MGSSRSPLFALWWTLCACGPTQDHPDTRSSFAEADRAQVLAVLEAQRNAWNQGDLEGYMSGYEHSPRLVFTSKAVIRRGWQDTYDKYVAKYGSDPSTMGSLAFAIEDVRGLGSEAAVVLGTWELTGTSNASKGVFTVVVQREPDGWKIVHDHTSAEPG